jgi:hypothetical protein
MDFEGSEGCAPPVLKPHAYLNIVNPALLKCFHNLWITLGRR